MFEVLQLVLIGGLLVWVIMATRRMRDQDRQIADLWKTLEEMSDTLREEDE